MSAFAPTDLALVAPLTFSEVTRAKRTLETPSTTKDERETAIGCLEEIYELPTTSRTSYHYGAACCLLAMYSTQDTNVRRSYAHKCLTEARKKLKKNPTTDTEPFQDEYSVSEQIFKGLQKMARLALDMIGNDVRRARAEGKLLEPKQVETGHVKKKKKVSWGGIAAYEGDEDYDDADDDDDNDDDDDEEEDGETGALGDEHESFVKVYEDEEERREAGFGEFHHDAKTMDTKWPGIIDSL
ncbi:hypothetical protein DL95DRAFT_459692 [Leptodontidium sp. 2 PMI_412]|nr:hypothetical protein DL95DRAFT_459692 [Leptodontidium sp. 2 PMI_412]